MMRWLLVLGFCVTTFHACKSSSSFSGSNGTAGAANGTGTPSSAPSPNTAANPGPPAPAPAPLPANAVTQGSFTVWTVPADPAAFQSYTIYTQVSLPAPQANYSVSDLSGHLVGTDGYTQTIGGAAGDQFQYNGGTTALMMTKVPGSYNGVQDTIAVASTLLNEQQTIKLVFGSGGNSPNANVGNNGGGGSLFSNF